MPADKNTRERTEGATTAVQEIDGDSFSVNQGDPNPKVLPALVMTPPDHRISFVQGMMPW